MNGHAFDVDTIAGRTILHVDSDRIGECMQYWRVCEIDAISINYSRGYRLPEIEFLRDYVDLTDVSLVFPLRGTYDLSPLYELKHLRKLHFSAAAPVRLERFPEIESFTGEWHPHMTMSDATSLTWLWLRKYRTKSRSLVDFPLLPQLKRLDLIQGNVSSLEGIQRLKTLRHVSFSYLTRLQSIEPLTALELVSLELDACRKIQDFEVVSKIPTLRQLKFLNCGKIQSLDFLRSMPNLDEFRFVGTDVIDGDLAPLLNLRKVGFLNKRHYSHTDEELDAILRPKGGGAVVRLED